MQDPTHPDDDTESETTSALRLWLSDQQWISLLARIERSAADYRGRERRSPRFPLRTRCIVRVKQPDGRSSTYLVRARNISCGGLGFIHPCPMAPSTRSTVALQTNGGAGLIAAAKVIWCRELSDIDPPTYEVGLQFDQPIDVDAFIDEPDPPPARV